MLLTAGDRLSPKQLRRLTTVLATGDPTNEIGAAWGCRELLSQLLDAPADREEIRTRPWRFYTACAAADIPETTRLATTVETWWPAILVAIQGRHYQRDDRGLQPHHQAGQASPADSATWTTSNAAYSPTARSPDCASKPHEHAAPLKVEGPLNDALMTG